MTTAAAAWQTWFPTIEAGAAALTQRMIALGGIRESKRVLDIGTGIGEPALSAARAVGPNGCVIAIDPDPGMIDIARERRAAASATNVTFMVERAEALQLAPGTFDVVLCRWSLMFVDDIVATLAHLHRLLRPGGRLVAATWMAAELVPALSLARRTIHRHFGKAPPPQGPKTAFALADAESFARTLRDAGFDRVEQATVPVCYEFASIDEYVRFREDCTGPLFSGIGAVTADERREALSALADALMPYRTAGDGYRMENEACCTLAVRGEGFPDGTYKKSLKAVGKKD